MKKYRLIVIGAGAAGLVAAYIARQMQASVALIEEKDMGGDCLNFGCIPSKALIYYTRLFYHTNQLHSSVQPNFQDAMDYIQQTVAAIAPHDSIKRYTELGVDVYKGRGILKDKHVVQINNENLWGKSIVLATGASPFIPNKDNLKGIPVYTSDTIWNITSLPKKLLVIGGGAIGCELSQAFHRLGSDVTIINRDPHLMNRLGQDVYQSVEQQFIKEGINLYQNTNVKTFQKTSNGFVCDVEQEGVLKSLPFDAVLFALGRKPAVQNMGLEDVGVHITDHNQIQSNAYLQTSVKSIYTCGDSTIFPQFTHMAGAMGWTSTFNALMAPLGRIKFNTKLVPWCLYTEPEIAQVGVLENHKDYDVIEFPLTDLDRAHITGNANGMIKLWIRKSKIHGALVVGGEAESIIAPILTAIYNNLSVDKLLKVIFPYPTWADGAKLVAGKWRRKQISPLTMKFLKWKNNIS